MYNYNTDFTDPTITQDIINSVSTVAVVFVIILALIVIALLVLIVVSNCKIFKKAGEKWWKGLVPLYNSWVETKITGLAWWWFPIFVVTASLATTEEVMFPLASVAMILVSFNYNYNLAIKFGKSEGFAVLSTFLPFIGLPILAFGSAKYDKDAKVDENGVFSIKEW